MLANELKKILNRHEFKPDAKVIQRDHFGDIVELDGYNFHIEPETGHLVIYPEDIGPEPD
jgi:hypothetical protein